MQGESARILGTISSLEKQITEVEAEIVNVNARSKKLGDQLGMTLEQAVALTSLSQSTAVQELLTRNSRYTS